MKKTNKKSQEFPVVIRSYAESDIPFIMNSWIFSFTEDLFPTLYEKNIPKKLIAKVTSVAHPLITQILNRCGAIIACDPDDYDHIIGYIVAEHMHGMPIIHWVYVKHFARQMGIGRMLYRAVNPTHQTALITFKTDRLDKKVTGKYALEYDIKNLEHILKWDCDTIASVPSAIPQGA